MAMANIPTKVDTELVEEATAVGNGMVSSAHNKPDIVDTAVSGNDAEPEESHSTPEEDEEEHDDKDEDAFDNLYEDDAIFAEEYKISASQMLEKDEKPDLQFPIAVKSQWQRAALSPYYSEYTACSEYRRHGRGKLVEITPLPKKEQLSKEPRQPRWSGKQGKPVSTRPSVEGSASAPISLSTHVQPHQPTTGEGVRLTLHGTANGEPLQVQDDGLFVAPNEEFALKWVTIEYELEQYLEAGLVPEDSVASAGLDQNSHYDFKLCAQELQNHLYEERLLECLGNLRGFRQLFSTSDDRYLRQVFKGRPTEVLQNIFYGGDGILQESRRKVADPFGLSEVGKDAIVVDVDDWGSPL